LPVKEAAIAGGFVNLANGVSRTISFVHNPTANLWVLTGLWAVDIMLPASAAGAGHRPQFAAPTGFLNTVQAARTARSSGA
jgi:hypothetical protein